MVVIFQTCIINKPCTRCQSCGCCHAHPWSGCFGIFPLRFCYTCTRCQSCGCCHAHPWSGCFGISPLRFCYKRIAAYRWLPPNDCQYGATGSRRAMRVQRRVRSDLLLCCPRQLDANSTKQTRHSRGLGAGDGHGGKLILHRAVRLLFVPPCCDAVLRLCNLDTSGILGARQADG